MPLNDILKSHRFPSRFYHQVASGPVVYVQIRVVPNSSASTRSPCARCNVSIAGMPWGYCRGEGPGIYHPVELTVYTYIYTLYPLNKRETDLAVVPGHSASIPQPLDSQVLSSFFAFGTTRMPPSTVRLTKLLLPHPFPCLQILPTKKDGSTWSIESDRQGVKIVAVSLTNEINIKVSTKFMLHVEP